jgi:hypothetical protein
MSPLRDQLISIMLLMSCQQPLSAQEHTPSAIWWLPGARWQVAKNTRLQAQVGYNRYLWTSIFYPQAFITIHPNIVLNPAYFYTSQKREGLPVLQEHYLANAIIFQAARKNWFIDDRNMLWNRLTVGAHARHYYRNRLRLMPSFKIASVTTRPYVYDEIFYLFNEHTLSRNRAAFGVSSDLTKHINIDITCIRQWDRYAGNLNLFFIAGFWQW